MKILWTWIKIRANSFIKTLVNNMKRKSTKGFHRQNAVMSSLIFHVEILPVNMELLLMAKITPGLNTGTCHARAEQFSAC